MSEIEPIIIKLQSEEDLNEKIIEEKGNTKCIFYSDDVCRKGDKTRDCVNCARVEYHSLYSLNWNNQERLQKELKRKEQECEELKDLADHNGNVCNERLDKIDELEHNINELNEQCDQLKAEIRNRNEKIEELRFSVSDLTNRLCNLNAEKTFRIVNYKQALKEIKEMCKQKFPVGLSAKSCYESFEAFTGYILQKCEVLDD